MNDIANFTINKKRSKMAKDILVNTQSGDLLMSDVSSPTAYWDVVWGKIVDGDEDEYMNIIVPSKSINDITYSNNKFKCLVQASYHPVNKPFLIRLVVKDIATNEYTSIRDWNSNAPSATGAVYYPQYTGNAEDIMACQLPLINPNGYFEIVFKRYDNSNFTRAIVCSATETDFDIGTSDNQEVQMITRCAPAKYYRYPTTGLDLTNYINSVVEHTNLTSQLITELSNDNRVITEASFDNATGNLQVIFSGTNEASDGDLTDRDSLNLELFRIADDDFVREYYKASQSISASNEDYINDLNNAAAFMGLYDMGKCARVGGISPTIEVDKGVEQTGDVISSTGDYLATMELKAMQMYAVDYSASDILRVQSTGWTTPTLFAIYDGDTPVYIDNILFSTPLNLPEWQVYSAAFSNRKCFIPLKDLTVKFYAGTTEDFFNDNTYGVRPVLDKEGNYDSILGLLEDSITGKISGIVTTSSAIKDAKVDIKTNQILIIKQDA